MSETKTISRKLYEKIEDVGEAKVFALIGAWERKKAKSKKRYDERAKLLKKAQTNG